MPAWPPASPWRGWSHNQAVVHLVVTGLLGHEQGLDGELVEGPGEMEALAVGAAEAGQLKGLGLLLDALGDHPQAEEVGDAEDGVGQGRLLGPIQQAVHERLGQLEDVDGEVAEIGQGRVAGAEVVDGQVDAEGPQAAEALQHGLLVGGQDTLGDLQHQLVGVEAGGVQGAGHVLEQVGLLELAHRQVDAEERVGLEGEAALPVAGGLAGGVQDPAADGTISPVSSARATNSPGMTRPRSGWSQRTSASSPASLPPGSSTTGW